SCCARNPACRHNHPCV
uniref:Alpha-conotoxin AusIA n=1 Tax=Conus australis TaxID=1519798 RepID=CA1A_CONAV|nr:RecName: Full=Alpha-conotoxin AusIA [Conus australis]7N0W_G Chain G, Ribbon alpha-conotoxin AusIA [Conus australis]7N0Y_G Chain G, Globular alpha-conotoxin AusIA [Conus australis]